jgi:hypothetical protein
VALETKREGVMPWSIFTRTYLKPLSRLRGTKSMNLLQETPYKEKNIPETDVQEFYD